MQDVVTSGTGKKVNFGGMAIAVETKVSKCSIYLLSIQLFVVCENEIVGI